MNIVSVTRQIYDNKLEIILDVFPPLYVFASGGDLGIVFISGNSNITFSNIKYDSNGRMTITADFTDDLFDQNLSILFQPSASSDNRYFASFSQVVVVPFPTDWN